MTQEQVEVSAKETVQKLLELMQQHEGDTTPIETYLEIAYTKGYYKAIKDLTTPPTGEPYPYDNMR